MCSQNANLFKCPVCETVVEVLEPCGLELNCCGPALIPLAEAHEDTITSHSPLVRWTGRTVKVAPRASHAMNDEHRIAWIEVRTGSTCYRTFFKPGQTPQMSLKVSAEKVKVRLYCTQHGLHGVISERPGTVRRPVSRRNAAR